MRYKEETGIDGCHGFGVTSNEKKESYQTVLGDYGIETGRKSVPAREKRDETIAFLYRIAKEVEKDPEVAKKAEEDQREYGTLTGEDLTKIFYI